MGKRTIHTDKNGKRTVIENTPKGPRIVDNLPGQAALKPASGAVLPDHLKDKRGVPETGATPTLTAYEIWKAKETADGVPVEQLRVLADKWDADPDIVVTSYQDLLKEGHHPSTDPNDENEILHRRVLQQQIVANVPGIVNVEPPGSQARNYKRDENGWPTEVYYASYGSNMFADRMHIYLTGGTPEGAARTYEGARNNALPTDDIPIALPGTIHYAGESGVWTGGIAFLDTTTSGKSLGRAYRITREQFDDVVAQESNMPVGETSTDYDMLLDKGQVVKPGAYGRLVHVGDYNNAPVYTFTAPFNTAQSRNGDIAINPEGQVIRIPRVTTTKPPEGFDRKKDPWPVLSAPPSEAYINMISNGLAETHHISQEQARTYIAGSTGALPAPQPVSD